METKAHKKKIKKKMPRRVKKRRKVQTDDGVRNLFKLLQVTLIVCRHAIRCLCQNVAWHIDSVFSFLTNLFQMWLLSEIIRNRVYNILASLQFSFLFVRFYIFLWRFETLLKYFSLQSDAGWEEYYDYIFPDDEANMPNFKLLQMARLWKKNQQQME